MVTSTTMRFWLLLLLLGLLALGLAAGCGDETPPGDGDADADTDTDADTDGDGDGDADPPEYFPLTPGTSWDYEEDAPGGGQRTLHKEITRCETITFPDCASGEDVTFDTAVWDSTGSANPDENGTAFLTVFEDGRVERVMQEMVELGQVAFTQRYAPGFLRFPAPPYTIGRELDDQHLRCETDEATGADTQTTKNYHWTIEAQEAVDVPAGHFADCLRTRRVNQDTLETKLFWFCDGVGKALEQSVDGRGEVLSEERLTAYTIGPDACAF